MATIVGVWISAFLTLAIFSFLYKDNPIYKFAEHLFIGVAAGYTLMQAYTGVISPNLLEPLHKAFTGESPENFKRLFALVMGVMLLLRLFPKISFVSRMPLALMIGAFAALRMTGLAQSDLIEQARGTLVPLRGEHLPWFAWEGASVFNHLVLIVGVISVLVYFLFSIEQKGLPKKIAGVGTIFLMITFGSSFGFTVLGRVSLLIGRAQDLYTFAEPRYGYASIFCALGIIAYLVIWERRKRSTETPRS